MNDTNMERVFNCMDINRADRFGFCTYRVGAYFNIGGDLNESTNQKDMYE